MNDHKCCQYHIASIMHIKKSLIVVAAAWKILLDTKTSMTNKSSFKIRNMKLYGNRPESIKLSKQHLTTIFCTNISLVHQSKFFIDLDKKNYLFGC